MTNAGVAGTAGFFYRKASLTPAGRAALFINRDDERLGPRYIGPRYPQAPAGATPRCIRRERRVASALRRRIDFMFASLICGPAGAAGQRCCAVPAAIGTA